MVNGMELMVFVVCVVWFDREIYRAIILYAFAINLGIYLLFASLSPFRHRSGHEDRAGFAAS